MGVLSDLEIAVSRSSVLGIDGSSLWPVCYSICVLREAEEHCGGGFRRVTSANPSGSTADGQQLGREGHRAVQRVPDASGHRHSNDTPRLDRTRSDRMRRSVTVVVWRGLGRALTESRSDRCTAQSAAAVCPIQTDGPGAVALAGIRSAVIDHGAGKGESLAITRHSCLFKSGTLARWMDTDRLVIHATISRHKSRTWS